MDFFEDGPMGHSVQWLIRKNLQIVHIARKGGKLSLIFPDTSSLLYIVLYIPRIFTHIPSYPILSPFFYITPSNHEHVCFKTSSSLWLTKYITQPLHHGICMNSPYKLAMFQRCYCCVLPHFFPSLRRLRKSRLQPAQLLINDLPMANLPGMCSVRGPNRFHPAGYGYSYSYFFMGKWWDIFTNYTCNYMWLWSSMA